MRQGRHWVSGVTFRVQHSCTPSAEFSLSWFLTVLCVMGLVQSLIVCAVVTQPQSNSLFGVRFPFADHVDYV